MLKKLLKHEFRATARTYGGLYLALLAVSVLFGASIRGWNGTNSDAYSTAVGLLSLAYTAVLIGTAVVTVMTIVQRFYGNLLGREGYLMHTLPVTEAQLVGAKLISGTVWSVCSIFTAGLSFGILAILMMAEIDLLDQLPWMLSHPAAVDAVAAPGGICAVRHGVLGGDALQRPRLLRADGQRHCLHLRRLHGGPSVQEPPCAGGHPELFRDAVRSGLDRKAAACGCRSL